ncbi:MAG: hypothetical protein WC693_06795 [Patescibacteria group bacterium]|jgi:hypothetical protein
MSGDSSEPRPEGLYGQENSAELINGSDSPVPVKPEHDCRRGNQYVLANTGCGMVFLKNDEETVTPI